MLSGCRLTRSSRNVGSSGRHPEWMTALHGARLAATAEMPTGGQLRGGLFKTLTGADTIRANRMRRDGYSFMPTIKLLMYGNTRPAIQGDDTGLQRRLVVVPCFPASEVDETLPATLRGEAGGILHWMACSAAESCRRHKAGKLWLPKTPRAIRTASAAYFSDYDPLGQALEDTAVLGEPESFTTTSGIRAALQSYYDREGLGAIPSHQKIAQRLRSLDCIAEKQRGERGWWGLRLRESIG